MQSVLDPSICSAGDLDRRRRRQQTNRIVISGCADVGVKCERMATFKRRLQNDDTMALDSAQSQCQ